MNAWVIIDTISCVIGLICLLLAGVVIIRAPSNKIVNWAFAIFAASVSFWIFTVVVANFSNELDDLVYWTKSATIISGIAQASFVQFAILFRRPQVKVWKTLVLYLPVAALVGYIVPFPLQEVYTENPFLHLQPGRPVGGILSDAYAVYVPGLLIYALSGIGVLIWRLKTEISKIRNQAYYITAGAIITMVAGIMFDAILPVMGVDYLYSVGPAFAATLVGCTAYAIVKHELMDIKIIIQRGVVYTALFTVIAAVYILAILGLASLLHLTDKTSSFVAGLITVLAGVFGVPPLEKYFRRRTDRLFFKQGYDYASAMESLTEAVKSNLDLSILIHELTGRLQKIFKNRGVAIVTEQEMPPGEDLLVEISSRDERVGFLVLKPKLSGDAYTKKDLQLLTTFAPLAAVAIQKSRLYEELKNYSQQLEERVAQRTEELGKLQQQQKQMMIEIAHNLQTPLTVVKGDLETLRSSQVAPEKLMIFEKSVDYISKFSYDMLYWAKLERTEELQKEELDLSGLLQEQAEYFEVVCRHQDINLVTKIEPALRIRGDKQKLQELITNLISNSIKYIAPPRQVSLSLKRNGSEAILQVKDTGMGIEPADLKKLFNPFFRGSPQAENGAKGSGLGLAICKRIAGLHGGRIEVDSQLGRGTALTVTLPILK